MSWEQRLRDMVLAGGAGLLAAVGCVDGSGGGGDSGADGGSGGDGSSGSSGVCCNANSDPCCPSLYCGAVVTPECTSKMACESDGGTWDIASQACSKAQDAALEDASPDAVTYPDVSFCCNANADPCCPSLHCGATQTVVCTEKMACESDGGTWDYGDQGCVRDAGAPDVKSDAP
ncbi:MAG TPA: hypothetical protein VH044_03055 [Polyangiaceae bacterium]|jgi:hypothetical protein|nr:hypothetical protein [Polyangiaceae bacterium]